jgi:hypothetical protein
MARKIVNDYSFKPKKKRPGVHSKNRFTKQTSGKYYSGRLYRGQGR